MDEAQFQNMDTWKGGGSKFGLTFKQIILMHINRCVLNGSVEWHGGYYNEYGNNPVVRTYVQNSRDVYCNSVKMLRACLLGYFDKKIIPVDKELQEEYTKKYEEYEKLADKSKDIQYKWYRYRIDWHVRLFEELILLSKRLNFFEEESSEVEM